MHPGDEMMIVWLRASSRCRCVVNPDRTAALVVPLCSPQCALSAGMGGVLCRVVLFELVWIR